MMSIPFVFVGGPLDGLILADHHQANAVGRTDPIWTETSFHSFLMMPSPEQCQRILNGEEKEAQSKIYPYLRHSMNDERIEFRYALAEFIEILQQANNPPPQ